MLRFLNSARSRCGLPSFSPPPKRLGRHTALELEETFKLHGFARASCSFTCPQSRECVELASAFSKSYPHVDQFVYVHFEDAVSISGDPIKFKSLPRQQTSKKIFTAWLEELCGGARVEAHIGDISGAGRDGSVLAVDWLRVHCKTRPGVLCWKTHSALAEMICSSQVSLDVRVFPMQPNPGCPASALGRWAFSKNRPYLFKPPRRLMQLHKQTFLGQEPKSSFNANGELPMEPSSPSVLEYRVLDPAQCSKHSKSAGIRSSTSSKFDVWMIVDALLFVKSLRDTRDCNKSIVDAVRLLFGDHQAAFLQRKLKKGLARLPQRTLLSICKIRFDIACLIYNRICFQRMFFQSVNRNFPPVNSLLTHPGHVVARCWLSARTFWFLLISKILRPLFNAALRP